MSGGEVKNAKIRERIRLLREMTAARGCTEAEAQVAFAKAAQMMRDHGLSEADIIMDEARSRSGQGRSIKALLWPTIARCTNTALIVLPHGSSAEVSFIGKSPGPDIAIYLREVCERAIDRAVREFKVGTFYRRRRNLRSRRDAVADFSAGMIARLNKRMLELFADAVDVASRLAARTALAELYPDTRKVPAAKAPFRHADATDAGWMAGAKVHLAHGVGGTEQPVAIGVSKP